MPKQTPTQNPQRFHLTEQEIANVKFRHSTMEYLMKTINSEIGGFVYQQIVPRLGLPEDTEVKLSEDEEWVEVVPKKSEIIIPKK